MIYVAISLNYAMLLAEMEHTPESMTTVQVKRATQQLPAQAFSDEARKLLYTTLPPTELSGNVKDPQGT